MHPAKLKQLEARLYSQVPLIGGCLRQRAAQALAQDGSPDAVRILAKAIARSNDRQVLAIALDALRQIRKQQCIDEVCEVWAITRHKDLANLLIKKGWVASVPVDIKVISALKAGQLEVVTQGGAEIVEPLLKAFSDADSEIASRASQCAIALTNPDAIDYLCERWSKTRERLLEQLILQRKYVARKPIEVRVLSALKAGQRSLVIEGGVEIIEPLLSAFSDEDREIVSRAKQCANTLVNPNAIDYLCDKWVSTRDRLLEQVSLQGGYVARQPMKVRVLTALKTGKGQTIARDEAQIITLLLQACEDTDPKIASEATAMLGKLRNQVAIDALCSEWAKTRAKHLMEALQHGQYVAATPAEIRVLSALKVGKLEAVINDGTEVIELLFQASKDIDSDIAKSGQLALRKLKNPEAQEVLCRLVIEQDNRLACEVVVASQYTPRDSNQRALFYFLTEQWDKYESLDYEYTLLQTAYQVGDEQLRQRITQKVRQTGRTEWLQIIAGGHKKKRLGEMTHDEWETALDILNRGRKWEEMWQLAQVAPPIWSVRLLRQLKDAGWVPKAEFAELVQMGQKCVADVPDRTRSSWRCQATLQGHGHSVKGLVISPDSRLLVSGSYKKVRLWSLPDGKLLQTLTGHTGSINCLAISPNGRVLASGSQDGTIRLWSLPSGKPLQTLTADILADSNCDVLWVFCLAISPDGQYFSVKTKIR
jgi:HEAT repeat protein